MTKIEITGEGKCPKCGSKIEIRHIESFPFPDDEQTRIIEVCQNCNFEIEKSFTSTNATTSFDHSILREMAEQRVAKSIEEIISLISSYPNTRIRPNITTVAETLNSLQTEDFPLLYVKLAELANSPLAEIRFDDLAEIMMAGESDRQFSCLSDGMAEWYENEARAAARGKHTEKKVLDSVVELVKLVEGKSKET